MANRQVTPDGSDNIIAAAVMAQDFWGIKNLRLIEAKSGDHTKVVVNPNSNYMPLNIGAHWFLIDTATDVDAVDNLDTGVLAAGTDYYVYACTNGTTVSFLVSASSTVPTGFDANHSRKIGGFHTLCLAVGTISGHTLSGYATKDILPQSIWCLKHRANNLVNAGMVYDTGVQEWVDIYPVSGTGTSTASAFGASYTATRCWLDFVDDGFAVGKRLLEATGFQRIAAGSNEETFVAGGADPVTVGGHVDTAGRRMVSNIGCEDCCGMIHQWLVEEGYRFTSEDPYFVNLPGGKGSRYTNCLTDPGSSEVDGDNCKGSSSKLIAGGAWSDGAEKETTCGSRRRSMNDPEWAYYAGLGARFCCDPL